MKLLAQRGKDSFLIEARGKYYKPEHGKLVQGECI